MAVESPPAFTQAGSFSAEQTRRAAFAWAARTAANSPGIISGGLLSATDCQVTAPASGLSVNVGTGEMLIGGTEGGSQGGYGPCRITSQTNLSIAANGSGNPRIDLVCGTVNDAQYTAPSGGVASGQWAPIVLTGTPTASASLTNLLGAPALPGSSLLLAYVLVPTGASSIVTADIANVSTQVRSGVAPVEWAYAQITSPAAITATVESGSTTIISPSAFTPDGFPVMVEFWCPFVTCDSAGVADAIHVSLWEGATEISRLATALTISTAAPTSQSLSGRYRFTPTAASHTYHIAAVAQSTTGSPTIGAGPGGVASYPPAFVRFSKA